MGWRELGKGVIGRTRRWGRGKVGKIKSIKNAAQKHFLCTILTTRPSDVLFA
jgi:hypothetical protein